MVNILIEAESKDVCKPLVYNDSSTSGKVETVYLLPWGFAWIGKGEITDVQKHCLNTSEQIFVRLGMISPQADTNHLNNEMH